jgi:hypothetical protein
MPSLKIGRISAFTCSRNVLYFDAFGKPAGKHFRRAANLRGLHWQQDWPPAEKTGIR